MHTQRSYDTVTEALSDLSKRGYTTDFTISQETERLRSSNSPIELSPDEFEIDEIYRFEGSTDPGDEMIVYAISSTKHPVKGVVVNAFGPYADPVTSKIVKRLKNHIDEGQPG